MYLQDAQLLSIPTYDVKCSCGLPEHKTLGGASSNDDWQRNRLSTVTLEMNE